MAENFEKDTEKLQVFLSQAVTWGYTNIVKKLSVEKITPVISKFQKKYPHFGEGMNGIQLFNKFQWVSMMCIIGARDARPEDNFWCDKADY